MHPLPDSILPLLEAMSRLSASDLHLKTGIPATYRIGGELRRSDMPAFRPEGGEIEALLTPIIPPRKLKHLEEHGALDFAYHLPSGDRFRCAVMKAGEHMHACIRRVKAEIPGFEELHLPPIYSQLADQTNEGLILVVGVTGCGKSTTMAAMIDHINATRAFNIISIEDPVEYVFHPKRSIISQRELGLDLESFADGIRSAVRQDPDIIFVGELRDRETILAALQAAETGHLVFATLHTADTCQAFTRILEFFPQDQHPFIRSALANGLKGILAQRLLPSSKPEIQRVPATEVLLAEPVVVEKIREGEEADFPAIVGGEGGGMHSFTGSLARLVEQDLVYLDTALDYAPNREQLVSRVRGIKTAAQSLIHRVKHREHM